MTSSDAPTSGARSILLITSRSDFMMPGPPLRGILSPAATSITYSVRSESSGLMVAAAFDEDDVEVGETAIETRHRFEIDRGVFTDGRVRAAAGFDTDDTLGN